MDLKIPRLHGCENLKIPRLHGSENWKIPRLHGCENLKISRLHGCKNFTIPRKHGSEKLKDPQIGTYVRLERRTVRSAGQPGWRARGGGAPQGPPPCSARPGRGPAAPPPAPSPRSACACCRRCRRRPRGPGTLGYPEVRSTVSLQRGSAHCALLAPVRRSSIISGYALKITCVLHCAATVPIPRFMFLWAIYIFLWSVCLFCCREIYRSLTDTWMGKLGLRGRYSFSRNT